ncbi:MFS transporter [Frateuria sp. Soil773]|uniref:MFS transporter n=1 Tax=Frateuria sp. Soil773 TaxID=1736407 RepID=UPI0006FE43E4|nr:MFS transporter [Frateuria sp. Soil773]KRE88673.1 MFS transporter [Frateuria sp. Soil773]
MSGANTPAERVPVRLFALATGVIVVSLYLPQPLVGPIGASLGLSPAAAGLVSTLLLAGYAAGLFLLVPLSDLVENRRLILATLATNAAALAVAACPIAPAGFLAVSFVIGLTTCSIQMLVPLAAAMTAEARRGRVIGNIMSGLLLGAMLSRPLASLVAERFGWRAAYALLAAAIVLLGGMLAFRLPRRRPPQATRYGALVGSLAGLWRGEPVLRRRALSAAASFAAFNAFWSLVALPLAAPPFGFGAAGIAAFALASISGAISAPVAGRLGDAGKARAATHAAHVVLVAAMLLAGVAGSPWAAATLPRGALIAAMGAAAILLDAGTIADQALGRRAVNLLQAEARGRINGLYTGVFFLGGAAGSAVAGVAWAHAGWTGVCAVGALAGVIAFMLGLRGGEATHAVEARPAPACD